jgi:hypothetical protein
MATAGASAIAAGMVPGGSEGSTVCANFYRKIQNAIEIVSWELRWPLSHVSTRLEMSRVVARCRGCGYGA